MFGSAIHNIALPAFNEPNNDVCSGALQCVRGAPLPALYGNDQVARSALPTLREHDSVALPVPSAPSKRYNITLPRCAIAIASCHPRRPSMIASFSSSLTERDHVSRTTRCTRCSMPLQSG